MAEFSDYSRHHPRTGGAGGGVSFQQPDQQRGLCALQCQARPARPGRHGVLAGLTEISEIISSKVADGKKVPCEGELYYRGYPVENSPAASSRTSASALRRRPIF